LGRKRNRTREHLYFFIACVTFMSLAGCATLKEMEVKREARKSLVMAQKLLDQGDYEGSLRENQKVLSLYESTPPGDEALFNAGLIYAHDGYPKRNYQKSLDHFKRLVKVFPESPFTQQVKIWIRVLQENQRLNREIEELNETIKKSKRVDIEVDEKKKEFSK